jgi:hypothetical protein
VDLKKRICSVRPLEQILRDTINGTLATPYWFEAAKELLEKYETMERVSLLELAI